MCPHCDIIASSKTNNAPPKGRKEHTMRYLVSTDFGLFESDSRDAKKHLHNHGGERVIVYTKKGKPVSGACMDEQNRPYSINVLDFALFFG